MSFLWTLLGFGRTLDDDGDLPRLAVATSHLYTCRRFSHQHIQFRQPPDRAACFSLWVQWECCGTWTLVPAARALPSLAVGRIDNMRLLHDLYHADRPT